MKVFRYLVLLLVPFELFSQSLDYNTKKGFVAEGYDVVSYFERMPLQGKQEFTTKFDGANYKFATKEHLEQFKANPSKYIPQYGGYCAYAVAEKGKKVDVDPKTFLISDGKLYLFYNAWGTNTLDLWNKEHPELLQQKANKNWKAIMYKE